MLLPEQVLEMAAACTLGPSLDVDTDAEMRSLIFSHFRVSGLPGGTVWDGMVSFVQTRQRPFEL